MKVSTYSDIVYRDEMRRRHEADIKRFREPADNKPTWPFE